MKTGKEQLSPCRQRRSLTCTVTSCRGWMTEARIRKPRWRCSAGRPGRGWRWCAPPPITTPTKTPLAPSVTAAPPPWKGCRPSCRRACPGLSRRRRWPAFRGSAGAGGFPGYASREPGSCCWKCPSPSGTTSRPKRWRPWCWTGTTMWCWCTPSGSAAAAKTWKSCGSWKSCRWGSR